jgi:hypothetical protein
MKPGDDGLICRQDAVACVCNWELESTNQNNISHHTLRTRKKNVISELVGRCLSARHIHPSNPNPADFLALGPSVQTI